MRGVVNGCLIMGMFYLLVGVAFTGGGCKTIIKPDSLPDTLPLPLPFPTTTTTTIPPADALEILQGFSHPTPVTDRIEFNKVTESNIYFSNSGLGWGIQELVGECQLSVNVDGKWSRPKKFDHIRNNTTQRDFINIHDGYQGWVEPSAGTPCAFFMISYDKLKRTNAIFFNWR